MKSVWKVVFHIFIGVLPTRYRKAATNQLMQFEFYKIIDDMLHKSIKIENIYDIGANKGDWTIDLSKKFPKMKFYLFEANSIHENELKKLNHWYNTGILSDVEKDIEFYSKGGTGDSYFKENTSVYSEIEPQKFRSQTLDSLIEEAKIPFPDFLKIDTQGSELDILKGAKRCLSHTNVILLECPIYPYNNQAPKMSDYVDFLLSFDFYPAHCVELHNLNGVFVQIDIIFMSKDAIQKSNKGFKDFYMVQ
jgi:FkbM family methyltransferase